MIENLTVPTETLLMMDIAVWITAVVVVAGIGFTLFILYLTFGSHEYNAESVTLEDASLESKPSIDAQETD